MQLTIPLHLVLRLRISITIPQAPHTTYNVRSSFKSKIVHHGVKEFSSFMHPKGLLSIVP